MKTTFRAGVWAQVLQGKGSFDFAKTSLQTHSTVDSSVSPRPSYDFRVKIHLSPLNPSCLVCVEPRWVPRLLLASIM